MRCLTAWFDQQGHGVCAQINVSQPHAQSSLTLRKMYGSCEGFAFTKDATCSAAALRVAAEDPAAVLIK